MLIFARCHVYCPLKHSSYLGYSQNMLHHYSQHWTQPKIISIYWRLAALFLATLGAPYFVRFSVPEIKYKGNILSMQDPDSDISDQVPYFVPSFLYCTSFGFWNYKILGPTVFKIIITFSWLLILTQASKLGQVSIVPVHSVSITQSVPKNDKFKFREIESSFLMLFKIRYKRYHFNFYIILSS